MSRSCARCLGLVGLLWLVQALAAQSVGDMLVADYDKRRKEELIAAGQRHVDLGWSIRDKGLQQQATLQFVRAVDVSEGTHQGAAMVLGIVRNYGEAFWRKKRKVPSKAGLADYEKRAAQIERDDMKGQIKLAKLAQKARLDARVKEHWLAALRLGAKVEVVKDVTKIDGEAVPAELLEWLQKQTVEVNGSNRRYEAAGIKAPKVANVREVASERLVVRTDLPGDAAEKLHALGLAEWPLLQERLDGAPVRPLGLFVFSRRADYAEYLKACGHEGALGGSGLCDYGTFQTLVCAEGLAEPDLHAMVLHELSHLFFFGCSPVAMPDWYAEGFAESFGGQGTFAWDGKQLTVAGMMRKDRVQAVQKAPMPLREMFAGDAAALLANNHEQGLLFYAQCWAFQRFLLRADGPWRERFCWWEDECRGALLGANSTARLGDPAPAKAAFDKLFAQDLDAIEKAFREWLAAQ
jgi:hypothetical protein